MVCVVLTLAAVLVALFGGDALRACVPSVLALALVLILRQALTAIWLAALVGLWIAADFSLPGLWSLFADAVAGIFTPWGWKFCAIVFTLLMGGFAMLLEGNGGMRLLVERLVNGAGDRRKRVEWTTFGAGIFCFFDGLASALIVGRLMRRPADEARVSSARMAYIVDATSSSVTCLAFVSTWIAFQLGMIQEGLQLAGWEAGSYGMFFRTILLNFYCLLTLLIVAIAIHWRWNPGMMARSEAAAESAPPARGTGPASDIQPRGWSSLLPLPVLILSLILGLWISGSDGLWPTSFIEVAEAFGNADAGRVLVIASAIGVAAAWLSWPVGLRLRLDGAPQAFRKGVGSMLLPVAILIGAWLLGSALGHLKTADVLVQFLGDQPDPQWIVPLIFLLSAVVGISTGTSWGTIGILLPLVVPLLAASGLAAGPADTIVPLSIAAVFGGAVMGDHCSPLSDTTIVSAAACGVSPREHVLTQLPYAAVAGLGALLLYGFFA